MSPRIEIRNSHVIDPAHSRAGHHTLYIAENRIVAWDHPPSGWVADHLIDAPNWITCPGLVDISARLREPGLEYRATLESEMLAAVSGGITSLVCPPDTDPVLDEPGLVEMLKHRTRQLSQAHVYPLGALTLGLRGQQLTEMAELTEAGCVGFSHAEAPLFDTHLLYRALQYAATFDYPVWLRPQDPYLSRGGVAHDGHVATRLGLPGIPTCAETLALQQIITLMRQTGTRVHICQLSSAEGVALVRQAKADGLPITADVSIHHLHLCDIDIGYFNSHCHLSPPLRSMRDRDALQAGVEDGTLDAICSDHTPVDDNAKQLPFGESEIGATGLELLLPLTLHWANTHNIELPQAIAKITHEPAKLLGLPAGHLSVGAPADLCLFDPDTYWEITPSNLHSQGKNTPFLGMHVPGKVMMTIIEGKIVYQAQQH